MQSNLIRIPFKRNGLRGCGFLHPNPVLAAYGCSSNFIERFWKSVHKTENCWLWIGTKNLKGYGNIPRGKNGTSPIKAHRASWIIHNGTIPKGLCVLHNCPGGDRADCVNPQHLWLGTIQDNNRDQGSKGRRSPPPKFYGVEWHRIHDGTLPEPLRGEAAPWSKLSWEKVLKIRAMRQECKLTFRHIGHIFGVSEATIRKVVSGKSWRWIHTQPPPNATLNATIALKNVDDWAALRPE